MCGRCRRRPARSTIAYWKNRGSQTLVIGKVTPRPDGKVEVRFRMLDTAKEAQVVGYAYTVGVPQLRAISHKIADLIYEKLTGEPGVFSTRIAYVAKFPQRFELHVADADGFNSQFILAHKEPIISPTWSPDGTRIAYVSFEQRRSIVFVHNLVDGTRRVLAAYDGINSAPAWAPDGKHACPRAIQGRPAADLSDQSRRHGSDAAHQQQRDRHRSLASHRTASTSCLLLTAAAAPQIYRMSASGGKCRAHDLRRQLQRDAAL